MKMICPQCGVKGSADDSLLRRKVKCPKCLGIFQVNKDVLLPIPIEEIQLEQLEGTQPLTDMSMEVSDQEVDDVFDELLGKETEPEAIELSEDDLDNAFVDEPAPAEVEEENELIATLSSDEEENVTETVEEDETLTVIEDSPEDEVQNKPEVGSGLFDNALEDELSLGDDESTESEDFDWGEGETGESATDDLAPALGGEEALSFDDEFTDEPASDEMAPAFSDTEELAFDDDVFESDETVADEILLDSEDDEELVIEDDESGYDTLASEEDVFDSDTEDDELLIDDDTIDFDEGIEVEDEDSFEEDQEEVLVDEDFLSEADESSEADELSWDELDEDSSDIEEDDSEDEDSVLIDEADAEESVVEEEETTEEDDSSEEDTEENDEDAEEDGFGENIALAAAGATTGGAAAFGALDGEQEAEEEKMDSSGKFTIGTLIRDSWTYAKGVKGSIWMGIITICVIFLGLGSALLYVPVENIGQMNMPYAEIGLSFVANLLGYIFTAGLFLIVVRKIGEEPFSWKMVFSGFKKFGTLTLQLILITIMVLVGLVFLVLPGIYLAVGYVLAPPLVMAKNMSAWQAMEKSRMAVHKRWWTVFFTLIIMTFLVTVSAIPVGIGLIWTIPMFYVLFGILFYHFFGDDD